MHPLTALSQGERERVGPRRARISGAYRLVYHSTLGLRVIKKKKYHLTALSQGERGIEACRVLHRSCANPAKSAKLRGRQRQCLENA